MSTQEQAQSEPNGLATDHDALARETGWVPKEEWKGKAENWKPAAQWLERSNSKYVPSLEKEIGALKGQLARERDATERRFNRLEASTRAAVASERARLEAEYEERILKATALGDTEGVKTALTAQKRDMAALADKAEKAEQEPKENPKTKDGISDDVREELTSWAKDNDWFNTDRRLRRIAIAFYDEVEEDMPAASVSRKLEEVRKRVEEEFPSKFTKKNGADDDEETPSRVESGSRNGAGQRNGWSSVPRQDRDICDGLIKGDGLFLSKEARAEWTKTKTVSDAEMGKARQKWLAAYQEQK